jgi:hypothetical protein
MRPWTVPGLAPAIYWRYFIAAISYACSVRHDCL